MAKSTYTVERSATMAADPQRVYDQVADFHHWPTWSPWEDLDPEQERTYSGAESGTGARYAWSGNRKAGRGRMHITRAAAPSEVQIALDFEKPFRSSNTTTFTLRPEGDGTHVHWTMTGPQSLLLRLFSVVRSMDSMVGKDFEKGLRRLKAVVERPTT